MANKKYPGFIFYPGDYLRDTQCLSERVQVAYDRIMCEHMRNICISHQQHNFFTKRLNEEEKRELAAVLTPVDGGFQITWVVESILKSKAYSDSRKQNRVGKKKKISESYDKHMDTDIDIPNTLLETIIGGTGEKSVKFDFDTTLPALTLEAAERNQFTHTGQKNTQFIREMWETFVLEREQDPPVERVRFQTISDLTKYFLNFMRTKFPKNGTDQKRPAEGHNGTAKSRTEQYAKWVNS